MIGIKDFSIKKKLIAIQLLTAFIVFLFFGIFVVLNVQHIIVAFFVLIAGMIIALLLSISMQRTILNPILHLVKATKEVSETGNYSIRVKKEGADEIGVLCDGFNTMLEQIHKRQLERDKAEATLWKSEEKLLRESEEKFRKVFESSNDAIMLLNEKEFFDCNSATLKVFGYTTREEFCGKHPGDVSPPTQADGKDSRQAADERIAVSFREGRNFFEWTYRRINGEDFPAEVLLTPFELEGRKAIQATVRDITERKRAEEELNKYREHLEELVKERTNELEKKTEEIERANIQLKELDLLKSMFIASMSHELRTPLNSIIGFTGIILQGMTGKITEEQKKQLTMVKKSAHHLLALINDVIDVSKIEAGKVELLIEEFDLSTIAQEVKDSFTVAVDEKDLKMFLETPKRLVIKSDERRVKQIIVNLMGNAVKFTEEGEIEIKVAEKDGTVALSVRDTGIGMRKDDIDRLFKAFSQIPGEGKIKEGTGLGLYLSQKIADLLGGEIKAESEFGKGSKFTFILPLKSSTF